LVGAGSVAVALVEADSAAATAVAWGVEDLAGWGVEGWAVEGTEVAVVAGVDPLG
jgi:hypothetical protein